ncbi:transcriptional regulator [Corynebacterium kutscheri]|uniref:transcriptional regulator n=1 Tax=Corynebacterium kutscheri TaxID=35755 RepID=UPI0037BFDD81
MSMEKVKARLNPEILDKVAESLGTTDKTQIAARLCKSVSTLDNWRRGVTAPGLSDLLKLQLITGMSYESMILRVPVAQCA